MAAGGRVGRAAAAAAAGAAGAAAGAGRPGAVVWLHGLGDSGRGWSDLAGRYAGPLPGVKWAFPDAPAQPVSCNGGHIMPSWFDLAEIPIAPGGPHDEASFSDAVRSIHRMLDAEVARGTPSEKIIVGGFSQGGALALRSVLHYPKKLGGCVVLSGWAPGEQELKAGLRDENRDTRVWWGHGVSDQVVRLECMKAGETLLGGLSVPCTTRAFAGMEHSACPEELEDVQAFLQEQLGCRSA